MKLVPKGDDDEGPGLWINEAWRPGQPGTFAVIIGVSAYTYLDGGPKPLKKADAAWIGEARALGQLHVSATTAFRMFEWLASSYLYDAPLARCWLLLAPTEQEARLLKLQKKQLTFAEPTLENCRLAIRFWREAMENIPAAAAPASRGMFFFSGHGLESTQERQLLLPSDYLRPPAPGINDAIATSNVRYGLASLKVGQQLFFVDACRNDHIALRGKNVVGASILVEDEAALVNPALVDPVLYATAAGQRAWEHTDPRKGISIFGQALLDGMSGRPDIKLKRMGKRRAIEFSPLQNYLKRRVVELIRAAGSKEDQFIKLGGSSDPETVVTYLVTGNKAGASPRAKRQGAISVAPGLGGGGIEGGSRTSDVDLLTRSSGSRRPKISRVGRTPRPASPPPTVAELQAEATPLREQPSDAGVGRLWSKDFGEGHRLFGGENITDMWQHRVRVWGLLGRRWRGPESIRILDVRRDKDLGRHVVRLQIEDPDSFGHWLQLIDDGGGVHACILPNEWNQQTRTPRSPVFEIATRRAAGSGQRAITSLEAGLAEQEGPLGVAANMWRSYSTEHLAAGVAETDASKLKAILKEKTESPLAATVATLILLRANRTDRLPRKWVWNLANWFPELPDGPILLAEHILREKTTTGAGAKQGMADAADSLSMVNDRGLPRTGEAFEYAAALVERLKKSDQVKPELRDRLAQFDARLDNAFAAYRPGGLFASFSNLPTNITPDRLWEKGIPTRGRKPSRPPLASA